MESTTGLLRSREAAKRLAISTRKLWELTNRGSLPHVRVGRAVRYDPADLDRWVEDNRRGGCAGVIIPPDPDGADTAYSGVKKSDILDLAEKLRAEGATDGAIREGVIALVADGTDPADLVKWFDSHPCGVWRGTDWAPWQAYANARS